METTLNAAAPSFVPNVNAHVFVPGGGFTPSLKPPPPPEEPEEPSDNWEDDAPETSTDDVATTEEPVVENKQEEEDIVEKMDKLEIQEEKPYAVEVKKSPSPPPVEDVGDGMEHINIIFIGHVDAGKSTIGGQLLFQTGQVDKRTLEKYEREAKEKNRETWYLSWALDTNLEERNKGKTVECGRASFDTESKHFVLLDAPGHKSFVPNMIGGAAQADIAVLVISARKGEFETGFERGGQTREHAMLAKTAGVKCLIVLVNKMDDPTVLWDEGRYKEIETKLSPFLKKSGFKSSEMTFMPASGFTGANLKDRVSPDVCPWYKGPSFLEYLDKLPDFEWPADKPAKILVSERFKDMGTIIIGKVEAGTIRKGNSLTLMPNKTCVKIMSVTGADEQEKNVCKAGENVKLKLSGVEEEEVLPGFILCDEKYLCNSGRVFNAQVVILEHKSIICAGYKAVLHIHNAVEEVVLVGLVATIDRKTGEKSKTRPRFIKQDSIAIARFKTANLICMETFADFAPMGRFTLRDEGRTIAIGKVLKIRHKNQDQRTADSK